MWRIIALPMAGICAAVAIVYTIIWFEPFYIFAGVAGTAIYIYMYVDETSKAKRRTRYTQQGKHQA